MPRSQKNDNFIDKTFTIVADILLRIIPTTQREKEAFGPRRPHPRPGGGDRARPAEGFRLRQSDAAHGVSARRGQQPDGRTAGGSHPHAHLGSDARPGPRARPRSAAPHRGGARLPEIGAQRGCQSPPRALTRSTVALVRRTPMSTAARRAASAAFSVDTTSR